MGNIGKSKQSLAYMSSQVCDVPPTIDGTQHTIAAPNHCLLLCDLHIGMTIDASLSENGEYAFVDGAGEVIADGSDVICWQGKRL